MRIKLQMVPVAFFKIISLPFQIPIEVIMRITIRIWKILREIFDDIQNLEWIKDYDEALKKAKQSSQFILAAFTSENCLYCRKLKEEVFETFEFRFWAVSNSLVLLEIDRLDQSSWEKYTKQYQINSIPAVLCLDSNGIEKSRLVGYTPGTGVEAWIQNFEQANSMNSISVDDIPFLEEKEVYQTISAPTSA